MCASESQPHATGAERGKNKVKSRLLDLLLAGLKTGRLFCSDCSEHAAHTNPNYFRQSNEARLTIRTNHFKCAIKHHSTFQDRNKLGIFSILHQIFRDGKLVGYIDGSNENVSSWMRFIRCARHRGEQNLFAFQYLGKVFYRTFKKILPGQEMLVWYDEKYPQYLGVPQAIFDLGAVIPRGS